MASGLRLGVGGLLITRVLFESIMVDIILLQVLSHIYIHYNIYIYIYIYIYILSIYIHMCVFI